MDNMHLPPSLLASYRRRGQGNIGELPDVSINDGKVADGKADLPDPATQLLFSPPPTTVHVLSYYHLTVCELLGYPFDQKPQPYELGVLCQPSNVMGSLFQQASALLSSSNTLTLESSHTAKYYVTWLAASVAFVQKYNLQNDPMMMMQLWSDWKMWISTYHKNTFCARMTSTQPSVFCLHIMSILEYLRADEFPIKYILKRYTMGDKSQPTFDTRDYTTIAFDGSSKISKEDILLQLNFTVNKKAMRCEQQYDKAFHVLMRLVEELDAIHSANKIDIDERMAKDDAKVANDLTYYESEMLQTDAQAKGWCRSFNAAAGPTIAATTRDAETSIVLPNKGYVKKKVKRGDKSQNRKGKQNLDPAQREWWKMNVSKTFKTKVKTTKRKVKTSSNNNNKKKKDEEYAEKKKKENKRKRKRKRKRYIANINCKQESLGGAQG
ncbi:hypothetical protein D1007_51712 [Hordeum vulgare]|nr:hypothetical protein D1007_51712 [Hordeum vulgare]